MDDRVKFGDNKNYEKGMMFEIGIGQKIDYKKAYASYKKGMQEGHIFSKKKVQSAHLNPVSFGIVSLISLSSLIHTFINNTLWVGLLITGLVFMVYTTIHFTKFWYKTNYANIINQVMFYLSGFVLIPLSTVLPYMNGISFWPVTVLFIVGFFTLGAGVVLLASYRKKDYVIAIISGVFLTFISLIVYLIPVESIKYEFEDYEHGVMITGFRSGDKEIIIPSRINNKDVIAIGPSAFSHTNIEKITVKDNILEIHDRAFSSMNRLHSVILPDEIIIGSGLFYNSQNLIFVDFPELEALPPLTFAYTAIESFNFHQGLKSIGAYAFSNARNLRSVTLNSDLEMIGAYAFSTNDYIESVVLPNSVTYVGPGAFQAMFALTNFEFSDQLTAIPDNLFERTTALTNLEVPSYITSIGEEAFLGSRNLETLTLHDGITYIGRAAFRNLESLTSIHLPSSLSEIPSYLLAGATSLESVVMPLAITEIGHSAFRNTTSLTNIYMPESVEIIGTSAFEGSGITQIDLPSDLVRLDTRAFAGARNLKEVHLPEQITVIPNGLFDDARSLETVTFGGDVVSVGVRSFRNTYALMSINLGNSLVTIDDFAFYNSSALTSFNFNEGITRIGYYAFYGSAITNAPLPVSLEIIGVGAFAQNNALTSLTIYDTTAYVGYFAFYQTPNLTIYVNGEAIPETWNESFNPDDNPIIFQ